MNQYLLKISDREVETFKVGSEERLERCLFDGEGCWNAESPEAVEIFWEALVNNERLSADKEIGCLLLSEDKEQLSLLTPPTGCRAAASRWKEKVLKVFFEDQDQFFGSLVIDEKEQCIACGEKKYYYTGLPAVKFILEPKPKETRLTLPPPVPEPEQPKSVPAAQPASQPKEQAGTVVYKPTKPQDSTPRTEATPNQPNEPQNATPEDWAKALKRMGEGVTDTVNY